MKNDLKKALRAAVAAVLCLAVVFSLAACSKANNRNKKLDRKEAISLADDKNNSRSTDARHDTQKHANDQHSSVSINNASESYTAYCADCFDSGFYAFVAGFDSDYTFNVKGSAEWDIYILDDKFTDELDLICERHTPALKGDGTLSIKKNAYVYCRCSVNAKTAEAPDAGSALVITGPGMPKN